MNEVPVNMAYRVPENPEYAGEVKTSFSEVYNHDGAAWVSMTVEIPGSAPYSVDFDNPDQIRACYEAMGRYLANRGIFRRVDDPPCVNEAPTEYGKQ